jgi:hypothetical protein
MHLIRHIALLLNFVVPGLGSLLLSKWRVGAIQFVLWALAILAFSRSFYTALALLVIASVYAWGLYTAEYSPRTGGVLKKSRG